MQMSACDNSMLHLSVHQLMIEIGGRCVEADLISLKVIGADFQIFFQPSGDPADVGGEKSKNQKTAKTKTKQDPRLEDLENQSR